MDKKYGRLRPATPEEQKALKEQGILIFFHPKKKEPTVKGAEKKQEDGDTNLKP